MTIRAGLPNLDAMRARAPGMRATRRPINANRALGFEQINTCDRVAEHLMHWGHTVRRGLGGAGVVSTSVVGTSVVGDGAKRRGAAGPGFSGLSA